MDTYKRSLCSTCIHVNTCTLTSNKVFIWSCSEFEQEEESENKTSTTIINDFNAVKSKRELELI
ncbi:hypothetical protein [Polaribacter uvawellassae]|uniref:hypothetical protein n=1 Tax=Polaribacter uvawellassae TaxID=3133495 RepID=UPI00321BBC03